jgi:hypothetical protein
LVYKKDDLVTTAGPLNNPANAHAVGHGALKRVAVVVAPGGFVDLMLPIDYGLKLRSPSRLGGGDAGSGSAAEGTNEVVPLEHSLVAAGADGVAAGKRKRASSDVASACRATTRFGAVSRIRTTLR